jgi:hypothetical protein
MKLQLLLHPHQRTPDGIASAKRLSSSLGIHPTAEGAATISAEVDEDTFQSLFKTPPEGSSSGTSATKESLAVPDELKDYVQSISVAPHHLYMKGPKP